MQPHEILKAHRPYDKYTDTKWCDNMAIKVYPACALAWDYIDTILDLAAQQRRSDVKKVCRAVRECRAAYDRFRQPFVSEEYNREELENGYRIEDCLRKYMNPIRNAIDFELGKLHLSPDEKVFRQAVFEAMVLAEGVKKYATEMDYYFTRLGIPHGMYTMLQKEFLYAVRLLPVFIAAPSERKYQGMETHISIIARRIKGLEVVRK